MKNRLQQFLNAEQLSPARLSDIIGIQRSGMSHILSGRNKPSFDFIQKLLLKFPTLNSEWLITGKGKMYKESQVLNNSSYLNSSIQEISENVEERHKSLDIQQDRRVFEDSELAENSIIDPSKEIDRKKSKQIVKMLLIYSDGTFSDFRHEDRLYHTD
ncbi:MAG: helix-turn-helix transcriptional regulator [Rikenellaceae bacterium]|nr:helix-turn-helix transcriptional regulator [Rikenellaceae bacterium]